jgi:hypothetical protein
MAGPDHGAIRHFARCRRGGVSPGSGRFLSSDPGDVGGEKVDAVAVEVAAGPVLVLGGAGVGVSGEDLCVPQRDAGVEGVGDGGVAQGV